MKSIRHPFAVKFDQHGAVSQPRSMDVRDSERRSRANREVPGKEQMMRRSLGFVFAVVLAGVASLASAQISPYGSPMAGSAGFRTASPFAPGSYGAGLSSGAGLPYTTSPLLSPGGGGVSGSPGFGYTTAPSLGTYANGMSGSAGSGYVLPSPVTPGQGGSMVTTPSPVTRFPSVTCHAGGCSGVDGTQYVRGAGNVLFGSNGRICQFTAPGAPLVCG